MEKRTVSSVRMKHQVCVLASMMNHCFGATMVNALKETKYVTTLLIASMGRTRI